MLILWISWKKTSCSQNFEEETATKTPAPLQIRTLSAQEIIYAKTHARVHARCLAQSSRALFPKTPKTGFYSHQYQRDVISQNSHNCANIYFQVLLSLALPSSFLKFYIGPSTVQDSLGQGLRFQPHPQGTFPAIFLQYNLLGREWVRCYGSSNYKGHLLSVS